MPILRAPAPLRQGIATIDWHVAACANIFHIRNETSGSLAAVRLRFDRQFGQFLQLKRDELTMAAFAKRLGISVSTLYRLEHGEQSATWKYKAICRLGDEQVGQWSDVASISVMGA